MDIYIYIYIYGQTFGIAFVIMVIVIRNGHLDLCSNTRQMCYLTLGKSMHPTILPPAMHEWSRLGTLTLVWQPI